ncbi:FliM/FliN family flagellar motor switch protein [bacterium]|jgi:flagellar motor switch protein FliN/FliY|nr:hypothetical protein [Gemmatimonadota bacterium]MCH2665552.1 FliM/FliN family flagellar motor switch protein [bacterium]HCK11041.1 hypothetical protein [Candidatus Latescibacterota bacterium]|tara:strand:+ start:901 stop:1413 length:513 start_codon:yes stop_codon:yes gene_type:complete
MAEEEPQELPEEKQDSAEDRPTDKAPEAEMAATAEPSPPEIADPDPAEDPAMTEPYSAPQLKDHPIGEKDPETLRAEFEQLPILDLGELEKFVARYDDVPVTVSIELGRVTNTLQDIIEWKEGSVVETQKLSGMPMEIMVNGSLFGHGEVVVVGENLAIRITDLEKPNLD